MKRLLTSLLIFTTAPLAWSLYGQCLGSQFDFRACEGDTFSITVPACSGCTYNWVPAPAIPSNSNSAQFFVPANPQASSAVNFQISANVNDPVNACQFTHIVQVWLTRTQEILIEDLNGPWYGDTSQTYRYALDYFYHLPSNYEQTPTWFTSDGAIQSVATSASNQLSFPFPSQTDTVSIKWHNPNAPVLGLSRGTLDGTGNAFFAQQCYDTAYLDLGPAYPLVEGRPYSCSFDTLSYTTASIPSATYAWSVSGGTILAGQGSDSIVVAWPPALVGGTVEVERFHPLDTLSSPVFSVSSPIYPANILPSDTAFCQGNGAFLDASSAFGQQYLWSTGANSSSIFASSPGQVIVWVTDTFCNVVTTDTVDVTVYPNPTPNLGPDLDICPGDSVLLSGGGPYSIYQWSTNSTAPTQWISAPGPVWLTVADVNGCIGSDTAMVDFFNVNVPNLGADTILCADTSLALDAGSGYLAYQWSNFSSNQTIFTNQGGVFSVEVLDMNGCWLRDTIEIEQLADCVFPGDCDYNGVADNDDVLAIGTAFASNGPIRPNATHTWYGQAANDWAGSLPLPFSANYKQIDSNGDGIINDNDTLAVSINYGATHNKASLIQTGNLTLQITADFDSVVAGDTAVYEISLGTPSNPADSIFGIAFTINYDTAVADSQGLLFVDYANCWFAPGGNRLTFTKDLYPAPFGDVAVVRRSGPDTSGFGPVCRLGIVTIENISGKKSILSKPLEVSVTDIKLVNQELISQSVGGSSDSTVVVSNEVAIGSGRPGGSLSVYPVPARDQAYLEWPGGGMEDVEIYDLQGKLQARVELDAADRTRLDLMSLADGVYLLRVSGKAGLATIKFPVIRR